MHTKTKRDELVGKLMRDSFSKGAVCTSPCASLLPLVACAASKTAVGLFVTHPLVAQDKMIVFHFLHGDSEALRRGHKSRNPS